MFAVWPIAPLGVSRPMSSFGPAYTVMFSPTGSTGAPKPVIATALPLPTTGQLAARGSPLEPSLACEHLASTLLEKMHLVLTLVPLGIVHVIPVTGFAG